MSNTDLGDWVQTRKVFVATAKKREIRSQLSEKEEIQNGLL